MVWATQTTQIAKTKLRLGASSWQATFAGAHLNVVADRCAAISAVFLRDFGSVNRVCATNATTSEYVPSIELLSANTPGSSLIYYPHSGLVPGSDNCVAHKSGPWWQSVAIGPSEGWSFSFQVVPRA